MDLDAVRLALSTRDPFALRPRALPEVLVELAVDEEALRATGLVRIHESQVTLATMDGVPEAWKRRLHAGFDQGLVRQERSTAYLAFNVAVYGTESFRFDIVDEDQLARMIALTNLHAGQTFVDLGCAVGTLTAEVAERTGATGHGLDFAPSAIARAHELFADREDVSFAEGDLDDLPSDVRYDVALAFDTLHFALDLDRTLAGIASLLAEGGRLVACWTESDTTSDDPGETRLGEALSRAGWDWVALDATEEAHGVWNRARAVLPELEAAFAEAGETAIWESRTREAEQVGAMYDEGRVARFLFAGVPGEV